MRSMLIAVSTLALAACNIADRKESGEYTPGPAIKQNFQTGDFEGVALAGWYDVVVKVGDAASVRAEGDSKVIENLDIKVRNGTLEIGDKRNKKMHIGFGNREHGNVTIYVTTPRLTSAAIAGSGDMQIDKAESDKFSASVAGSGDMEIASLRAEEASFEVAGSGNIKASGVVANSNIAIAGSGDIDLAGVNSRKVEVSIAGSGNVAANVSETVDGSILGSGDVTIKGTAKCNVNKHGSGDIRCGI